MISPILRLPSTQDSDLARASLSVLHQHQESTAASQGAIELTNDLELQIQHQTMRLPPVAVRLLERILSELADGNAVAITPIQPEISTQEAADILNVSRPYLVGLLEKSIIPHRKVGTHRRVSLKALLEYKAIQKKQAEKAMQELADLSQELGLGY
jgi:excisionase family DNA binding protein